MTYKRLELSLVLAERGEAEADFGGDFSEVESEGVIEEQGSVNVGTNVSDGPRVTELATGDVIFSEARGVGV